MKKVLIISIVVTIITILSINIIYKKNKINITLSKKDINVYEEITIKDIINEDINIKNIKIDTTKTGNQTIKIKYKNKIFKYEDTININVVDKEKPTILVSNKTIEKGTNINLDNIFFCGDNYDIKPTCYVEGNYDIDEVGIYNLKYIAKDSSDNKIEKDFTLRVKEALEPKKNEPTKTEFNEVVENYKNEKTQIGIDVSKWQGDINFEKVKQAGCEFVIIKAAGSYIDGKLYIDPKFKENIENALKNNLEVGVYLYSNSSSIEKTLEEINYLLELIKDYDIKLGIAYDWENFNDFTSYNINLHTLNEMANTFLKETENKGYKAMLYSSQYYLENIWDISYDNWIAKYAFVNNYQGDYKIWQMCSDGVIDGINGYVDINIMYE